MIIKNLSWHRFNPRSLIRYISESDKTMEPNDPIYWNLLGKSEAEIIEEFEVNHQYRSTRKNSVMLHHDIISFSPQDAPHLNQDKIRDLTYQYLELRAKNNLAFAHIHQAKNTSCHRKIGSIKGITRNNKSQQKTVNESKDKAKLRENGLLKNLIRKGNDTMR